MSDLQQVQHQLFKSVWGNNYSAPVDMSKSVEVLDVGCGKGYWISELAAQCESANFHGVDKIADYPTEGVPARVKFQKADVLEKLPFKDNTFDYVHQSLLSTSFNGDQWKADVKELVRVLKPGGYLELQETNILTENADENGKIKQFVTQLKEHLSKAGIEPVKTQDLAEYLKSEKVEEIQSLEKIIKPGSSFSGLAEQSHRLGFKQLSGLISITDEDVEESVKELNTKEIYKIVRVYGKKH